MSNQGPKNPGDDTSGDKRDALEQRIRRLEERLSRIEQKLDKLTSTDPERYPPPPSAEETPSTEKSGDTQKNRPQEAPTGEKKTQKSYHGAQSQPGKTDQADDQKAPTGRASVFDNDQSRSLGRSTDAHSNEARSVSDSTFSFLEGSGWLNKLGAVLLVVGLLLLFKYSVDQGWITPTVRLAIGGVLSIGLMVWGLLTDNDRSRFRQVALGGGIAGFYITGFAAYYLYGYLSLGASWGYMLAVTILALYLSLREDEQVLAVLGLVGGFATPFLLYRDGGQYIDLILYSCLLLGVSGVIYFYCRWLSLLWVMFLGGLGVFGVTLVYGIFGESNAPMLRRWSLQGALFWYLLVLWPWPMFRSWLSIRESDRWGPANRFSLQVHQPLLVLILPLMVLGFSIWVWEWSVMQSGLIGLGSTVVLGAIYLMMNEAFGPNLKRVHLYSAFLVMAFSLWMLFGGDHLYAWLGGQMLLMHASGYLTRDDRLINVTHILGLGIGLHLADQLVEVNEWTLIGDNLGEIVTIGAFAGSSFLLRGRDRESTIYGLFALAAFLGWLANLFGPVADGQMYVTVSWGIVALLTLGVGYRFPLRIARYSGAGVLLLTLAKLVFYDLSHLDTIWRILLFLGFGLVLLLMGYLLSKRQNSPPLEGEDSSQSSMG